MNKLSIIKYPTVAPSVLSADKTKMGEEIDLIRKSALQYVHIDIMDGDFVPNKSFTLDETKQIVSFSHDLFKDVHIMVQKPWEIASVYAGLGADSITFHYEACKSEEELRKTISIIRESGCKVGVSINPGTEPSVLDNYLSDIDLILVMSVWPGRGGQSFIETSLDKIKYLRNKIESSSNKPLIEVDGGINAKISSKVIEAGADLLVSGSYLFGHEDFVERAEALLK